MKQLDIIRITAGERNKMLELMENDPHIQDANPNKPGKNPLFFGEFHKHVMLNPPIQEYGLEVTDSDGMILSFKIRHGDVGAVYDEDCGETLRKVCWIDGTVNGDIWDCSFAINHENQVKFAAPKDLSEKAAWFLAELVTMSYLPVQYMLINRPDVFRETVSRTMQTSAGEKKKRKDSARRAKLVCVRTVDSEKLGTAVSERHYTCPAWGVIGHKRRLKSGKVIWVKPHVKGKQRENPEAYVPKEYVAKT